MQCWGKAEQHNGIKVEKNRKYPPLRTQNYHKGRLYPSDIEFFQ